MTPVKPPATVRHLLVCTNDRDPAKGKPACARNGGLELREELKKRVKLGGLKGPLKVTASGCLDYCPAEGVAIGFYPENTFYVCGADEVERVWELLTEGVRTEPGSSG